MSYDTYLMINTGHEDRLVVDVGNYTYNVSGMFHLALGIGFSELDGLLAVDVIPRLRTAVAHMADHPADYQALNPSNGWGNYDGALRYLRALLDACEANPKCTIRVS